ncbi:hypothetical protein DRI96_04905 [Candidatus Aerophobetes bacterium]|uniref:Uncharacterized protein n=1 Tax=Aerophobetes bacterium TaxID=2030807 RepID=A0A662D8Y2_UNCAE|nr:MAG: hypothetical protein DRI96_04905 [Candidatus Aerophobetes bacterium]
MEQEKKIRWGTVAITVAILILAASVFFAGFKITNTINANVQSIKSGLKEKLEKDIRREAISFIYAYRKGALKNRQITADDLKEGYKFAKEFLSK